MGEVWGGRGKEYPRRAPTKACTVCAGTERRPGDFAGGACISGTGCRIAVCPFLMKELLICRCLASHKEPLERTVCKAGCSGVSHSDFIDSAALRSFEGAVVFLKVASCVTWLRKRSLATCTPGEGSFLWQFAKHCSVA